MCDWAVRTHKAGRQDWESNYQHYSDIGPISFFFSFFSKLWYLAENKREKIAFPIYPLLREMENTLFALFDDFWRLILTVWRRQTKNERYAKKVTMATNPLSTMRFHWSLGIFVIIFTQFSLISQSILNRFSCNFAGTTCNYSGDCPEKLVKFDRVLLKLLVRLVVNLLEYFKIYSFRRQFRRQFSTVYYVILQVPSNGITATAL